MAIKRPWAFWRRTQYLAGLFLFLALVGTGVYFVYIHEPANCFDGMQNGDERGVDCGGGCVRVCALDVTPARVLWADSFRVVEGQYNAVAYVENMNREVGSPEVSYTFTLSDRDGIIATRSGTTVLPPDSVYPIFEGRINTGGRVPAQTQIELGSPDVWLPADAGREQFFVESRTLTGADTAPRLDADITNTALTEAKSVEIIATIFDSKRNPLTASRTLIERFAPRTTERVVFTWPEPIAKTLRSCEVPTDVIVAIDLSGSMNDDGGEPPEPITSVVRAAGAFIERLNPNDRAGVISYATNAQIRRELTEDTDAVRAAVGGLFIDPKEERGSTNIGGALIAAREEFSSPRHRSSARKVLVLLTDGRANTPGNEPELYALTAADALKAAETEIYTIGLGENIHETFLREIATDSDHYFRAPSSATVDRIYQSVTAALCEDGAAVIEIIPKTGANFSEL